ncbi:uncharacterized protein LOC144447816 [Glandiceps talaboti]
MKCTLSEDGTGAVHEIDSLSYGDFDRTGRYAVWNLVNLFESVKSRLDVDFPNYISVPTTSARTQVTRAIECAIFPGYYTIRMEHFDTQVNISTKIVHIGRSSITCYQELRKSNGNEILATCTAQEVCFDLNTRGSIPVSRSLRERQRNAAGKPSPPFYKFSREDTFDDAVFEYQLEVLPSDLDFMDHKHNTYYIRDCLNVANMATSVIKDIATRDITRLSIVYNRESVLRDKLQVQVKEDRENSSALQFNIFKTSTRLSVVKCFIQFAKCDKAKCKL